MDQHGSLTTETAFAPATGLERDARRVRCAVGAGLWVVAFAWLWLGAPALGRVLGAAWFALGALWPAGFFYSLALAFPWLGADPGGPHHLYLIEMGLMGLVAGHLAARARGAVPGRSARADLWILLYVAYSWMTMLNTWQWFKAELLFAPRKFLFVIMNHYGTADVFGLQLAIKLTLAAGLYVVLRDRPWSPERLKRLWWVLLGGLTFTALVGWLHYAGLIRIDWWRGENPFIEKRFGWTRLQSLYGHPGWLAQYIEALGPGALALGMTARRRGARWGLAGLAGALAATQFFTMARAGWVGLAGGYAVVVAAATLSESGARRMGRLALRLGLLGAVFLALAGGLALLSPDLRHRLGEFFAWQHRFGIWKSGVAAWQTSPVIGVGLGNYLTALMIMNPGLAADAYWRADNITAHNHYLHTLAERGVIGLGLYLALLAMIVVPLARAAGRRDEGRGLRLAVLGGLAALSLDGLFQYFFYVRAIEVMFWMLAGWGVILAGEADGTGYGPRAWRLGRRGLALMLALITWYAHPQILKPVKARSGDTLFHVAGQRVKVPLPEGARRVSLKLLSLVPDSERAQPVETILLGDQVLRQVAFERYGQVQTVVLDLPEWRRPETPLVIQSSRVWSLWAHGYRGLPYAKMGVIYSTPERVE